MTHHFFEGSSLRVLGKPGVLQVEGVNPAHRTGDEYSDRWKPFAFVAPAEIGALAAGLDRAAESFNAENMYHDNSLLERSRLIRRAEEAEARLYAIERARAAAVVKAADECVPLTCGGCGVAMGMFTFDAQYQERAGAAPWAMCSLVCVEKVAEKDAQEGRTE